MYQLKYAHSCPLIPQHATVQLSILQHAKHKLLLREIKTQKIPTLPPYMGSGDPLVVKIGTKKII